ncbi:MAG: ribonuclease J [Dehalococcoidales bacterium]|nr:ribonuclease J [Dehalococcoidales bacterium]
MYSEELSARQVRMIPLGGVGEVGKNSTVIETDEDMLLIDVGVMFPSEEMHGIDLVIPDFSYVLARLDKLRGIAITHGHDDHMGALPYLLQRLPYSVPVYATTLTLGLAKARARDLKVLDRADFRQVFPGDVVQLGTLQAEFFHVSHSVPDAAGLIIHTPAGVAVYTGDFKLDPTPVDNQPTDLPRLRELGDAGVLVLLSDCVRAEEPGRTPSERLVGETLDRIVGEASGRVIITTFASNITRLAQTIHIAGEHNRKVAVVGRSMWQNLGVARDLNYLDIPPDVLVDLPTAQHLPPEQLILLTTGSQGEPASVLARIAAGEHPQIAIKPSDTVVMAANPVPGNEETVAHTIDNLFRRGAKVIYGAVEEGVHVSGHASRDELRELLRIVRPRYCVPMHGEYRHMILYQDLAISEGIPAERVVLPEIGDVLAFTESVAGKVDTVPAGSVLVDGLTVGGVTKAVLRERGRLAEDGVLIASVVIDRETGELLGGPDLVARGFMEAIEDHLLDEARDQVVRALRKGSHPNGHPMEADYGFIVRKVHDTLAKFIYQQTRRRPMVLPVVTEL